MRGSHDRDGLARDLTAAQHCARLVRRRQSGEAARVVRQFVREGARRAVVEDEPTVAPEHPRGTRGTSTRPSWRASIESGTTSPTSSRARRIPPSPGRDVYA
ncbi:MAG: hypothetical protein WCJ30_17480 [Deltaproteobacteria bacterium]